MSPPGLRAAAAFALGFGLVVWPASAALDALAGPRLALVRELNALRAARGLQPLQSSAALRAEASAELQAWLSRPRLEPPQRPAPHCALYARIPGPAALPGRALERWLSDADSAALLLQPGVAQLGAAVAHTRRGETFYFALLAPAR